MFDFEEFIKNFFLYGQLINKEAWESVFREMAVHTRKAIPERILKTRRPNEEDNVYNYRILNYEPITYGSMNKAFDSLFRLMNGINYSIEGSKELLEYISKKNFSGYNLEGYLSNIVIKRNIEDPNGFLLWYPSGQGVVNSAIKVEAKPYLVYSCDLHFCNDEVFSFLSNEKSKIRKDGKSVMEGKVYWIFTKNGFFKLEQVGKSDQNIKDYLLRPIYTHNLQEIPAIVLGGDMNADGFYESFFAPYCAFGNEAIRQYSDWQAALTQTVHPHVEEFATECELRMVSKNPATKDETSEKYEHRIELKPLTKSPFNTTLRPIPNGTDMGGILDVNVPSKRFIAPPVENARYSGESWEKLLEKAEDALHLNLGQTNQSGVAKEIDKEAHYSMITKIGNNFFDNIMLNSLKYIDGLVFPVTGRSENIAVNKPTTYKVKTEADLVEEIGTLSEKKVPSIFLSSATIDLAKKYFNGDKLKQKIFTIISKNDPLYTYGKLEMDSMLASSVITKEAYIRSVYMYGLLLQIAEKESAEKFIEMNEEKIMILFDEAIIEYLPEPVTPLIQNNPLETYE